MGKITVLIVDDHTLIRETWSFLLERNENFEVIAEVGDGQKGIDIATVAGMLGHTSTKYVHQTYKRYIQESAKEAIAKLPLSQL